jgi:hypothetical protein
MKITKKLNQIFFIMIFLTSCGDPFEDMTLDCTNCTYTATTRTITGDCVLSTGDTAKVECVFSEDYKDLFCVRK